jgi:hypothetical protein
MRSRTLIVVATGFSAVLLTILLLPRVKISLEYAVTAVSSLTTGNLLLQLVPFYCRCPDHKSATYRVRWG